MFISVSVQMGHLEDSAVHGIVPPVRLYDVFVVDIKRTRILIPALFYYLSDKYTSVKPRSTTISPVINPPMKQRKLIVAPVIFTSFHNLYLLILYRPLYAWASVFRVQSSPARSLLLFFFVS